MTFEEWYKKYESVLAGPDMMSGDSAKELWDDVWRAGHDMGVIDEAIANAAMEGGL